VADPRRLQVKIKLTEWLEGITPDNGYQHDLSTSLEGVHRVFRGRDKFGDNDPLPAAAILEPLNPDRDIDDVGEGRVVNEELVLMIQGWAAADVSEVHPTDGADRLLADLKKRIGELIGNDLDRRELLSHHNLYGLVSHIRVEPGTVRPPDQFSSLAYCYFRVAFGFVEKIDDPYGVV
jgi:hypothetical protein